GLLRRFGDGDRGRRCSRSRSCFLFLFLLACSRCSSRLLFGSLFLLGLVGRSLRLALGFLLLARLLLGGGLGLAFGLLFFLLVLEALLQQLLLGGLLLVGAPGGLFRGDLFVFLLLLGQPLLFDALGGLGGLRRLLGFELVEPLGVVGAALRLLLLGGAVAH